MLRGSIFCSRNTHLWAGRKEPALPSLSGLSLALLVSGKPRFALGRWQHTSFFQEPTLKNPGQGIFLVSYYYQIMWREIGAQLFPPFILPSIFIPCEILSWMIGNWLTGKLFFTQFLFFYRKPKDKNSLKQGSKSRKQTSESYPAGEQAAHPTLLVAGARALCIGVGATGLRGGDLQ